MRKFAFASASLLALSIATGASAADLPHKSVPPAFVPPAFTWTGFYIGVNAGYAWGDFERTSSGGAGLGAPFQVAALNTFGTRKFNADGFTGGAQIGYNYQINTFVLGLEADFNFADITKSAGPNEITGLAGNFLSSRSRIDWFSTVRGRLGVTFDRLLVYGTGGVAFGQVKVFDSPVYAGGAPLPATSSTTRTGYAVGAGLEYAFTNNLTAKLEYQFIDLGKSSAATGLVALTPNTSVAYENKTKLNVVRAGLNYKF